MPNDTSISRNRLFSIPQELRDAIWDFCLPDPPVIHIHRGHHPRWLLTSSQVFREAAPKLYNKCILYRSIDLSDQPSLMNQLWTNYAVSHPDDSFQEIIDSFREVKQLVSHIAIEVKLEMTTENLGWLCEHYFDKVDELPRLKTLRISLYPNLRPGSRSFRRQIGPSDLRIFHIVSCMGAIEPLVKKLPEDCRIDWEYQGVAKLYYGQDFIHRVEHREIAEFMTEVMQALAAAGPTENVAEDR